MSAEANSWFGILPSEMKAEIFDFLNLEHKKYLRLVCQQWKIIIEESLKISSFEFTNQTKKYIQNYPQLVSITIQNLTEDFPSIFWENIFPRCPEYILGPNNSRPNTRNFLNQVCTYTQTLILKDLSLINFHPHPGINMINWSNMKWSYLSTLSISIGNPPLSNKIVKKYTRGPNHHNHMKQCIQMFNNIFVKTLTTLKIHTYSEISSSSHVPLTNILEFILKHNLSLRELHLGFLGRAPDEDPSENMNIHLMSLNLEKFYLTFDEEYVVFAIYICQRINASEVLDLRQTFWNKRCGNCMNYFAQHGMLRFYPETMTSIHLYSTRWNFVLLPPTNPTLTTLEIKTGSMHDSTLHLNPSNSIIFPILKKFVFWARQMKYLQNSNTLLVQIIINQMPNIENIELILFDQDFNPYDVVLLFKSLQNLKEMTFSLGNNQSIENFTDEFINPFINKIYIKNVTIGDVNSINIKIHGKRTLL